MKIKNGILFFLSVVTLFTACKKEDNTAFSQSPDERLNAALSSYQKQLVGAENGWKAFISPKSGGTYFFYLKFNDQNRVSMYSTFDSTSAVTLKESSYRLKGLQQPSLLFDTYSYIHVLADPNENVTVLSEVNAGPVGTGLQSDFEFYFDSTSADTVKLVGRFNGSKAVFTKATKQEADAYNNKELAKGFAFKNISKYPNYFKRATVGSTTFEINVNETDRTITLVWIDGAGNAQSFTTPFYYYLSGINFVNPLVIGSQTITGFTNITWNGATTTVGFSVNGTTTTVVGANQPVKADVDAPKKWWKYAADLGDYWISLTGFHVNGVDNAYRIDTLKSGANTYYYWIYWPGYAAGNDFSVPVFINPAGTAISLAYGTAPSVPTFTADGRAIFTYLGDYGPYPATGGAALTRARLFSSAGFYFVQTGPTSYDMVNAGDSKIWISWLY